MALKEGERARKHREYNLKRYYEHRDLIRKRQKIYRDRMSKSPEYRASRVQSTTRYNELRELGHLKRDIVAKKCCLCINKNNLIIHHIDGNGYGSKDPNNILENLITLCRPCHYKIHHRPELINFKSYYAEKLLIGLGYII